MLSPSWNRLDMSKTYGHHSRICAKFYDLVTDPVSVAGFVRAALADFNAGNGLFIGGFFEVARELTRLGFNLSIADYTEEMISEGKMRLPELPFHKADLRDLPFIEEFDSLFTVGRVFTHMLSNDDAQLAISSIRRSLKPGGVAFVDNYESSKIQKTDYFNGRVEVSDEAVRITRVSETELVTSDPFIVNWKAEYRATINGAPLTFSDQMQHRAFSRSELGAMFEEQGFQIEAQGDNFDETSFFTVVRRF